MTDLNEQTGAAPEPTWVEMLRFAGVSPEVWNAMTDARRAEYHRAYEFQRQRAVAEGVADHA